MSALRDRYQNELRAALQQALGMKNLMQVPRLEKIVISMGVKSTDKDLLKEMVEDLKKIAGQAPLVTKSRKSISNFKLRAGMPIGAKVTLRGDRMYEFFMRLTHAGLPRIRDFRGLSAGGFDGRGSYSFGIDDQTIFPEIDPDDVKKVHGMNITFVTSAEDDKAAFELLKRLGLPFGEKT